MTKILIKNNKREGGELNERNSPILLGGRWIALDFSK